MRSGELIYFFICEISVKNSIYFSSSVIRGMYSKFFGIS